MADQHPQASAQASAQRRRSASGLIAGAAVLIALAALGIALYGIARQPARMVIDIQSTPVLTAGGGAVIAAIVAYLRSMSVWDILEAVWDAIAAVFSLIGAVLAGIGRAIMGLFGWD